MRSLFGDVLGVLNLLHQTVKVLMHLVHMCEFLFSLGDFESLNVGIDLLG
jgi:hypothetical protein